MTPWSGPLPPRKDPSIAPEETLTTGRTVVGIFRQRSQAEAAIAELEQAGFSRDQIGVAVYDEEGTIVPGATVGALAGGVVGSLVGLLGSFLVPGAGPILVGGFLASLVGAGIGATAGGIIGALQGIGVTEQDAHHFDAGLRAGGTLVAVSAKNRIADALAVLQRHEADLGPSLTSFQS